MSRIGKTIKARRQAFGMTGKGLACAAEFMPQYISDIELGRRVPPMETVLRIANVFPDVDSTAWLWLLLEDLWGAEVVATMKRWAVVEDAKEWGGMKIPCAVCGALTDNGLTVLAACDEHWDNPEQAVGILAECAGALENLMEDRNSERHIRFAEIALGRLRAMRFHPLPLARSAGERGDGR